MNKKELAFELAVIRKNKGISQPQMGLKIGVTGSHLSRYEKSTYRFPTERLKAYCKVLGVDYKDYKVLTEKTTCDVCGSDDIIEAPHMGKSCNYCQGL
jgi:transcriptional regulator with XRE-family HTH domain